MKPQAAAMTGRDAGVKPQTTAMSGNDAGVDPVFTKRIRVYGIVQGVGFRPTVSRLAEETGIRGSVSNRGSYVEIVAQGSEEQIAAFLDGLKSRPPKRSAILKIDVKDKSAGAAIFQSFEIVESIKEKGEIFVSPDIAICEDCKRELYDPSDRRYLHPFINCTSCGPRLTILDALPYDRDRTSMKEFPMCPECEREYYDPATRRYDAQPVCCNECGPQVYLAGRTEKGPEAIRETRRILKEGGIAAVKGIGGFHLCCDASSEEAVARLRRLKNRPVKPFAVMMKDEETVRRECILNEEQERILTGHQKPILLLERREERGMAPDGAAGKSAPAAGSLSPSGRAALRLCNAVAPGNPKVGVMLPYAPVQMLLFDYRDDVQMPDMLVMTSGNVSGAPICRDDEEALRELSGFCDCILSHNRRIRIRCDDSVMDFADGGPYMIRRSRGYAPLPTLMSSEWKGTVLAMGGELKNTFCIGTGSLLYPSSYIGDLADVRSVRALRETIGRMETLLEVKPQVIACDLHPGYQSTELAHELARGMAEQHDHEPAGGTQGGEAIPVIPIQHHYAHIVSCMAENDWHEPVLGASFDGTGYGTDGTIWGGEILRADYLGFERLGSIKPFLHVGGDAASREGWRIAASMLHSLEKDGSSWNSASESETPESETSEWRGSASEAAVQTGLCSSGEFKMISVMADRGINSVVSTSAGRLFDAVSAVLGICRQSTFEGEASCALQFAAEAWLKKNTARDVLPDFAVSEESDRMILPTDELFAWIVREKLNGTDPGRLAYVFHASLAEMAAKALIRAGEKTGIRTAALSGGVYQNTLLLKLTKDMLEKNGFHVLTHHLVPPNDGGICLGQAAAAMARIQIQEEN